MALLAAVAVLATSGCVRSKVLVTSDPPGADITMNDVHLGRTPVEMPFTWYWYYDFQAEMDGYETTVTRERFRPPFYLEMPFDLVMEAMPFMVVDRKKVHLELARLDQRPAPQFAD